MLGMAFAFLLGWQLARALGAAGYGVYGVAMAVVSILGVPSQFGLPQLLTREVASANATREWGLLKGIMLWSTRVALVSSLVIVAAIVGWVIFLGGGLSSPLGGSLAIGALLIPVIAFGSMSSAVLRGLLAVVWAQLLDTLMRPAAHAFLLFLLLLLGIKLTPAYAMAAGLIAAVCSVGLAAMLMVRRMPKMVRPAVPRFARADWRKASIPMALTEGLRVVQGQAAVLVLGGMVSMSEVGHFRVAASIMTLLAFPVSVINLVIAPHVSKLSAVGDGKRLRWMLSHAAFGMSAALFLMTLPFLVDGDELISTVFGMEFRGANPIVLVLAAGLFSNALFGAGATVLNMLGHQRHVTKASLWSVSLLCLMLWPAIKVGGALGAAVALTVSVTGWSAALWWDVRKLESIDIGAWSFATLFFSTSREAGK